ncbi:MAG TPA: DUF1206 domain-containing protein [Acidimicrobiales bacterium]|nr:DUF1206 domain-containing protein [Acidimicrobiales bacterium]
MATTVAGKAGQARSRAKRAQSKARQAKRRPLVQRTARISLGARALIYLVLAFITADIAATGGSGKQASSSGAIQEMVRQPAGPALVIVLALGLVAYAAWRFLQAAAGDAEAKPGEDLAKRVGWLSIGVLYLGLCGRSVLLLFGRHQKANGTASVSARLLGVTGGRELLVLVGLGVAVGGLGLVGWAVGQKFETYLPERKMPGWVDVAARVTGTYGNVIRGGVFAAVGVSLIVSGVVGTSRDAKGVDQVIRTLSHHAYGTWVLALVAAGFLAFSVSSVLEGRYREI